MYAQSTTRRALVSFVMIGALAGAVVADLGASPGQPVGATAAPAGAQLGGPVTVLPELVITAPRIEQ